MNGWDKTNVAAVIRQMWEGIRLALVWMDFKGYIVAGGFFL